MKRLNVIILLSTVALLSLITIQFISIKTTLDYNSDIEDIGLLTKKIGQAYAVINLLLDVETGGRGYLLTGVKDFLKPYDHGLNQLPIEMSKLNEYLSVDERIKLTNLVQTRVDRAKFLVQKKNLNLEIKSYELDAGKKAMDDIRTVINNIIAAEENEIKGHSQSESSKTIAFRLIGGSLFTLFMGGLSVFFIFSEFKKRIKTQKELHISLATSEAISRDIDFGIIACDNLGAVIFTNRWINNTFPLMKNVAELFKDNFGIQKSISELISGERKLLEGLEFFSGNEKRIYNISSSPFLIEDTLRGTVLSVIDVTDSSHKMASLMTGIEMADIASKAKSDFLAKMSHEIRTPLNAILGVGDILSTTKLDKEQYHCLEIFKRSAVTLNNLVNDILDLSKIEAGKIDLVLMPFSLNNLISSCTSIMDFRASQKGLLFTVKVESDHDHFVGDEGRIRQILLNLLSNAIKFTEKGEIKFFVKVLREENKYNISFKVNDTGKGISKENVGKLFVNYQQENSTISKEFGGTGLGLSLSKELARIMGGDIEIRSELGIGSEFEFFVSLPIAEGEFSEEIIDTNLNFNNLSILLVDDNAENRFIVRKYLKDLNIQITEAVDGEDAIDQFKKEKFDLIFMDINMPKKDGLTAVKEIRELEASSNLDKTLIIALSANALSLEHSNAINVGCHDYLTKPISRLKLITMIKKWISDYSVKGMETNLLQNDSQDSDEEIDYEIAQLIPSYLASRARDVEVIKEAFLKKEMAIISKLIHNIKGTALSYGQGKLDKVAREFEVAIHENNEVKIKECIEKMETILKGKH